MRTELRHRAGRIAAIAVGVFAIVCATVVLIAVITAPAAAPVIAAGTVLGSAAEAFSGGDGEMTGEELAQAGAESGVICDAVPPAEPVAAVPTPAAAAPLESGEPAPTPEPGPVAPEPIRIGEGGSISRDDVELLLEPLTPGTSTLRAQVWFLYRLAGMGDWAAFTNAYDNAGLSPTDESPDAPLQQVQTLNANGVPVERYRLTAAAMAEAGQKTGRFTDPYPGYEELLVVEVLSSCLSDTDAGESRMALPAPSITTPAPAPPAELAEPVPAEAIPAEPVTAES